MSASKDVTWCSTVTGLMQNLNATCICTFSSELHLLPYVTMLHHTLVQHTASDNLLSARFPAIDATSMRQFESHTTVTECITVTTKSLGHCILLCSTAQTMPPNCPLTGSSHACPKVHRILPFAFVLTVCCLQGLLTCGAFPSGS